MTRHLVRAALVVAFGISLFPLQASALEAKTARQVLSEATNGFIRPGYRDLADRASTLRDKLGKLCDSAKEASLTSARRAFGETVMAWSRVETIRFGPILSNNAAERIYFFPDRRGIGLRQVQGVLVETDETSISADTLAAKSVALQGLGTLEFLMFGTGAEVLATNEGGFRCQFATAVSERVKATAKDVADEWSAQDGIARRFVDPDPANADFQTNEDSLRALLGTFINGLEMVADTRIAPFLGKDRTSMNPKAAAWWRSGLTGEAIGANLSGLSGLFDASGIGRLLPEQMANLPTEIGVEFANAERALQSAGQPVIETAATEDGRSSLTYLLIVTRSLRAMFADRLAGAIGLVAGFSSLDGH